MQIFCNRTIYHLLVSFSLLPFCYFSNKRTLFVIFNFSKVSTKLHRKQMWNFGFIHTKQLLCHHGPILDKYTKSIYFNTKMQHNHFTTKRWFVHCSIQSAIHNWWHSTTIVHFGKFAIHWQLGISDNTILCQRHCCLIGKVGIPMGWHRTRYQHKHCYTMHEMLQDLGCGLRS